MKELYFPKETLLACDQDFTEMSIQSLHCYRIYQQSVGIYLDMWKFLRNVIQEKYIIDKILYDVKPISNDVHEKTFSTQLFRNNEVHLCKYCSICKVYFFSNGSLKEIR